MDENNDGLLNAARAAQLKALSERIRGTPEAVQSIGIDKEVLARILACRADLFTDDEIRKIFVAVELAIHKLEK